MFIKNLFFIITIGSLTHSMLATDITINENITIVCDNLIKIYKSNNNKITSDTLVSFIEQHNIESQKSLINILNIGKEIYQTELISLKNVLTSNKLSLFLTQIITWLSALGCCHLYQVLPLNYSQNVKNTHNYLDQINFSLNDFNDYLSNVRDYLHSLNTGHLHSMKSELYNRDSTAIIKDFRINVDSYIIDNQTTIINYNTTIKNNNTIIDTNNALISINKSYTKSLDQFKFLYIPLFIAGITYSSISLYDLYNKYQLKENILDKINVINKIINQITI